MNRYKAWTTALIVMLALPFAMSAWAEGTVASTGNPAAGAAVFHVTCVVCHGSSGRGNMPGMPDFNDANGVLSLPTPLLEKRITEGFSDGRAPMAMPPKGDNPNLTRNDVRNVIAYLRSNFQR